MKKIKVLMIVNGLAHEGISHCVMNYLLNLDMNVLQVDLCIAGVCNHELRKRLENAGITCFILPGRNQKPLSYLKSEIELIHNQKYQIVHVHGNSATMTLDLLGAFLGGCKIRIAHSHNTTCSHVLSDKLLRPLFYMLCTTGFSCSAAAGEWLFPSNKYIIIENAVAFNDYKFNADKRMMIRKKLNINSDAIVIGHIGCFNEQKNHVFTLNIFQQLCQKEPEKVFRLLLVGEGALLEQMKMAADSLGISDKVIFYGITDKVVDVLSAMDIFVFPSIYEGFGIVMLEAQLNGLPCLASDRVPQVVKISDDCTFIPLNIDKWLEAIEKTSIKQDRSFKNNQRAEKFNITVQAKKLRDIYIEMEKKSNVRN